ncbi:hypothetical protein RJT34_32853 [Clitoria ternatea]|uniref:Uncharacterized protein n=1 Tax=Clitoria ternatea TaxID=43366 RepID=A0AAN9EXQ6_CLITE
MSKMMVSVVAAYFKGWHFGAHGLKLEYLWGASFGMRGVFDWLYSRVWIGWSFVWVAFGSGSRRSNRFLAFGSGSRRSK